MGGLEKILLSWQEFGVLSDKLKTEVKSKYNKEIDVVIGIARGGLPISICLANSLGTKWDSMRIKSYTGDGIRGKIELVYDVNTDLTDKIIMLVDDIVDEGKTMQFAINYLNGKYRPKKIVTASIIVKPHSEFRPDDYVQERSEWIVFPWEEEK